METTESKFDQMYDNSDLIKKIQKVVVRKKMSLRFQSAFTNAEEQIEAEKTILNDEYQKFEKFDVSVIAGAREKITRLEAAQQALKDEYKELFGRELPVREY